MALEQDHLRTEIRRNTAGTVSFWPKTFERGNVTATSAEYEVLSPTGVELQARTAATIVAAGINGESRIDCAIPAQATIDEGYQCRIYWEASGVGEQLHVALFDVVAWPMGASISLNDILAERPKAGNDIAVLAQSIAVTSHAFAAQLGYRARVILDEKLRSLVADSAPAGIENRSELCGWRGRVYLKGWAVLDRARLQRVETLLALRELYRSLETGSSEDDDPNRALSGRYNAEADRAFRALGPLSFDFDGDLVSDGRQRVTSGAIRMRRVQS